MKILIFALLLTPLEVQSSEIPTAPTGWLGLGITCQNDPATKESFLLVHGTAPGGPASQSDLESGDVITAIGEEKVTCKNQLEALEVFRLVTPGQQVVLSVLRNGRTKDVKLYAIRMTDQQQALWVMQYRRVREHLLREQSVS